VDIPAIRAAVGPDIPILGILKVKQVDGSLFITPSVESALKVVQAGAELVALDGTRRPRPGGDLLRGVVAAIHGAGAAALADVDTVDNAQYAIECGADAVGTTLSGYTADSQRQEGPDFDLLAQIVAISTVPVFAEGRIWTREDVRQAIDIGAAFVVVGTAITNPQAITARFVAALGRETSSSSME
jgi:N-acylglucosamine-6-phosphate 2-epimerase